MTGFRIVFGIMIGCAVIAISDVVWTIQDIALGLLTIQIWLS